MSNTETLPDAQALIDQFAGYIREQRYSEATISSYQHSCRHFVAWLRQQGLCWSEIDEAVVEAFAGHKCRCPRMSLRKSRRNKEYLFKVRRFVRFLETTGLITRGTTRVDSTRSDGLSAFRDWLRRNRGVSEQTLSDHCRTITMLLPQLGDHPSLYDAALINRVMLQNLGSASRFSVQRMCRSLRMYLRFLATTGTCSAALVGAIPRIPRWRLATMPKYILNDDVERVIASCDQTTARGLRDRAILLLLARLALRGGDVFNLRLQDINWDNALIKVAGKTRHAVALPMPQDVGDALFAYIERARPRIDSPKVFFRVIAPFRPLASSSPIAIIVRDALKRAGVKNVNLRGAYLLRHSAATNMLRSGATLEAVGAVLRHRSPETTAIYAKVDTNMLSRVVQPWIGGITCL